MSFKNESQLRVIFRRCTTADLFWIEAALGGTDGLPDVFALEGGRMNFAELKKGEMSNDGILRFEVRTTQKDTLPKMTENGARGVFAVAELRDRNVHVFSIDCPGAMEGRVDILDLALNHGTTVFELGQIMGVGVKWRAYGDRAASALIGLGIWSMERTRVERPANGVE